MPQNCGVTARSITTSIFSRAFLQMAVPSVSIVAFDVVERDGQAVPHSRRGPVGETPRTRQRKPRRPSTKVGRQRRLGARDLGDETGDEALDLGRWQVVAGDGVRLAEIAADDEGAQPRARQGSSPARC